MEANHTPVDFDKLKINFKDKDKLKAEALRKSTISNGKREDEKIIERKDMEEAQKRDKKNMMIRRKKERSTTKKSKSTESVCQLEKQQRGQFMPQKILGTTTCRE